MTGEEFVYVNGEIVPSYEAGISVFDHGFLYGDGLFETMRSYGGKVFKLEAHLDRLYEGAAFLGMDMPWSRAELKFNILTTIKRNALEDAYVRLAVTRGVGPLGLDCGDCDPGLVIWARPLNVDPARYEKGLKTIILKTRRNPSQSLPPFLKSANFLNNIIAFQEVKCAGADDGLFLNIQGEVCEAVTSNIFIVSGNIIKTPPLHSGLLPGIARATVLELAAGAGQDARETVLLPEDIMGADEIFITNSISEVSPVVEVDGQKIGSGIPGLLTVKMLQLYRSETKNILK